MGQCNGGRKEEKPSREGAKDKDGRGKSPPSLKGTGRNLLAQIANGEKGGRRRVPWDF